MKKKLLAALLAVLALAIAAVTVFAADTPAYTVDENGNITLDVVINLKGDVNMNGKVNSTDALWIKQYVAGTREFDEYQLQLADVNGNGKINSTDALWISQQVAGDRDESFAKIGE